MKKIKEFLSNFSLSALLAEFIAVAISYSGPLVVVLQAAKVGHLSEGQVVSWIWAISIESGLCAVTLSLVV